MISSALHFSARHATWIFACAMAMALTVPPITAVIGPILTLLIFSMLTLSVMRTDLTAIAGHFRQPGRALAVIVWMLAISPLVVGSLLVVAPVPHELLTPLLFYTALPPLTAVPALAILFGIDAALAVVVLIGASLATPLILPPMMLMVFGVDVDIEMTTLFMRLSVLVIGSFLAGLLIRAIAGRARLAAHRQNLDGVIVIVMGLIVLAVFDGIHGPMLARPELAIGLIVAVVAASITFQVLSFFLFLPFGLETALTTGMLAGNRNLALILAVLGDSATIEIALFVSLGQLPVYLLPMIQRPLIRRLGFGQDRLTRPRHLPDSRD